MTWTNRGHACPPKSDIIYYIEVLQDIWIEKFENQRFDMKIIHFSKNDLWGSK